MPRIQLDFFQHIVDVQWETKAPAIKFVVIHDSDWCKDIFPINVNNGTAYIATTTREGLNYYPYKDLPHGVPYWMQRLHDLKTIVVWDIGEFQTGRPDIHFGGAASTRVDLSCRGEDYDGIWYKAYVSWTDVAGEFGGTLRVNPRWHAEISKGLTNYYGLGVNVIELPFLYIWPDPPGWHFSGEDDHPAGWNVVSIGIGKRSTEPPNGCWDVVNYTILGGPMEDPERYTAHGISNFEKITNEEFARLHREGRGSGPGVSAGGSDRRGLGSRPIKPYIETAHVYNNWLECKDPVWPDLGDAHHFGDEISTFKTTINQVREIEWQEPKFDTQFGGRVGDQGFVQVIKPGKLTISEPETEPELKIAKDPSKGITNSIKYILTDEWEGES